MCYLNAPGSRISVWCPLDHGGPFQFRALSPPYEHRKSQTSLEDSRLDCN
uniref:Uncharacterized protein n=1 Tax=Rhizophora mucronata TaxID=61149 RepID=A0A2P2JJU6_RHIMU